MSPRSVLVTGANRGIGFGLVQQFLKNKNISNIIATARNVERADALNSIDDPRLHVVPLTVTCDKSIDNFIGRASEIVGDHGLNTLVNNAGIAVMYKTRSVPDRAKISEQFDVNTTSVVILTQKLLPLLEKAAARSPNKEELSIDRAAVLNISSMLGSISENTSGSNFRPNFDALAYRMSKTALNQFTKTFSIDMKGSGILITSFCPGWVSTEMGGQGGPVTTNESVASLVDSFSKLNASHNGGYYNRELSAHQF